MTTLRQIQANRKNSEQSTGPKTAEGKAASRANALKHGLTGAGVVSPHEEADAIAQRMEAWRPSYQPGNSEAEWLYREMITQSVRVDRCQEQESAISAEISLRASLCWDDDRQLEAEDLGARLASKPARISHQLTRTRQGCEWMIDRWRALDALLESQGEWTEAQRSLALDLLGTPPELRDPADNFGTSSDAPEARAFIRSRIEHLEQRKAEALDALDQFEREAAEQGLPIQPPRLLTQLRRYEVACLNRFHSARNQLRGAHPLAPESSSQSMSPYTPAPPKAPAEPAGPPPPIRIELTSPPALELETPSSPRFASLAVAPAPLLTMNRQQRRASRSLAARRR